MFKYNLKYVQLKFEDWSMKYFVALHLATSLPSRISTFGVSVTYGLNDVASCLRLRWPPSLEHYY